MDKKDYKQAMKTIYRRDDDIIDYCRGCGKQLKRRDVEYTQIHFKDVVCRKCSPYGTPPIHERFNLNDPQQRIEAAETSKAEGYAVGKELYERRMALQKV